MIETIVRKINSNSFPHFNIINSISEEHQNANTFCSLIIDKLTRNNSGMSSDVLIIKATKNQFIIDDFKELAKFLSTSPLTLSSKIIIVEQISKLSTQLANKLLKVLEEPPINAVFFFTNPTGSKVIDTLSSRANYIYTPNTLENSQKLDYSQFKGIDFITFQETLKKDKDLYKIIVHRIGTNELNGYQTNIEAINILKSYKDDDEYNDTKYENQFRLWKFLQQHES